MGMGNYNSGNIWQAVAIDGDFSGSIDMTGDGIHLHGATRAQAKPTGGIPSELLEELAVFLGQVSAAGLGQLSQTAADLAGKLPKATDDQ